MSAPLARRDQIEIRIGDVPLGWKLDAIGAALAAVREAHRGTMPNACWAALHRAEKEIAAAILASGTKKG
ncbi:MAG: hypothetical protein JNK23_10430 [Opitutaceae bacterium]|nr:hypothetical protein [Opitutaceae bacterium]